MMRPSMAASVEGTGRRKSSRRLPAALSRGGWFVISRILILFATLSAFSPPHGFAHQQDDLRIWREFIQLLREGQLPADRIRPHPELGSEFTQSLAGYLDSVRTQAAPEDWTAEPEVVRVGERIQYIVPWSTGSQKVSYCFSFVIEDSQWYFQHLEAIFIRLDKISQLPVSDFPDVSEAQKNWAREEIYWSFVVTSVYLPVAREKGQEYALSMLKDGAGYVVGAKTWVPFAPPHKAFILYLCWEQSRLRGNGVTLMKLDDAGAVVTLSTHFFAVYSAAAHLKPKISLSDYRRIFETIWKDRASSAGWDLDIQYTGTYTVTFVFKRSG